MKESHDTPSVSSPEDFIKYFGELLELFRDRKWLTVIFETEHFLAYMDPYIDEDRSAVYRLSMIILKDFKIGIYKYARGNTIFGYYKTDDNIQTSGILPEELINAFISIVEDYSKTTIQNLTYDKINYV
jgi:hypothetical protein